MLFCGCHQDIKLAVNVSANGVSRLLATCHCSRWRGRWWRCYSQQGIKTPERSLSRTAGSLRTPGNIRSFRGDRSQQRVIFRAVVEISSGLCGDKTRCVFQLNLWTFPGVFSRNIMGVFEGALETFTSMFCTVKTRSLRDTSRHVQQSLCQPRLAVGPSSFVNVKSKP